MWSKPRKLLHVGRSTLEKGPHWFLSLAFAREKMEHWRRYYSEDDPMVRSGVGPDRADEIG